MRNKIQNKKWDKECGRNIFRWPLANIDMFGWISRKKIRKALPKSSAKWQRF